MGKIKDTARFVAPIFRDNEWKWAKVFSDCAFDEYIPDKTHIRQALWDLRDSAKKHEVAETGRLMVRKSELGYQYYLNITGGGK